MIYEEGIPHTDVDPEHASRVVESVRAYLNKFSGADRLDQQAELMATLPGLELWYFNQDPAALANTKIPFPELLDVGNRALTGSGVNHG